MNVGFEMELKGCGRNFRDGGVIDGGL